MNNAHTTADVSRVGEEEGAITMLTTSVINKNRNFTEAADQIIPSPPPSPIKRPARHAIDNSIQSLGSI